MRLIVGRHLHASAAIRSPVKKPIKLVTFEDVGLFSMDFLEGREGAERYLLARSAMPFSSDVCLGLESQVATLTAFGAILITLPIFSHSVDRRSETKVQDVPYFL